jgi:hypothetical protein
VTSPYIVGGYAVYWKFPSAVERTALSPNLNEVGRIAYQESDDSFWYLKDVGTWVSLDAANIEKSFFSANKGGVDQVCPVDVAVKVLYETEAVDTLNEYSSSRYSPTVPGKYLIAASVSLIGHSSGAAMQVRLYKNGVQLLNGVLAHASSSAILIAGATFMVEANGSDYFEIYTYCTPVGGATSYTLRGVANAAFFSGTRL